MSSPITQNPHYFLGVLISKPIDEIIHLDKITNWFHVCVFKPPFYNELKDGVLSTRSDYQQSRRQKCLDPPKTSVCYVWSLSEVPYRL